MATPYSNRCYVIFNTSELQSVDFNQVYETSADTVRKSVDGSKRLSNSIQKKWTLQNTPMKLPILQ